MTIHIREQEFSSYQFATMKTVKLYLCMQAQRMHNYDIVHLPNYPSGDITLLGELLSPWYLRSIELLRYGNE